MQLKTFALMLLSENCS